MIPSLRERVEDLPSLIAVELKAGAAQAGSNAVPPNGSPFRGDSLARRLALLELK